MRFLIFFSLMSFVGMTFPWRMHTNKIKFLTCRTETLSSWGFLLSPVIWAGVTKPYLWSLWHYTKNYHNLSLTGIWCSLWPHCGFVLWWDLYSLPHARHQDAKSSDHTDVSRKLNYYFRKWVDLMNVSEIKTFDFCLFKLEELEIFSRGEGLKCF